MIKITKSKYEPKTKLAIHLGKTVRHISYAEANTLIFLLTRAFKNKK